ncbi:MAG TPA: alpha/beta hydrolase [Flavobacterium sp.]|jgi:acetyl esterase/lipase
MKTTPILSVILAFFISSCSSNENAPNPLEAQQLTNVSYGNDAKQKFDLYLPANRNASDTKTLILVHGGSWIGGDKSEMNPILEVIRKNLPNYAVVNMNYRLSTLGKPAFPMQIDDIAAVIAKIKNGKYDISDNIGFIGVSAGGHLSLLYSYAYNTDKNVKMVCSIVGPTNFTDPAYTDNPISASFFGSVAGDSYANNPALHQQLSPLLRVDSASPPTLMFYGNQDPVVPLNQGIHLRDRLDQLGVYYEFTLYNGGHGNWSAEDLTDAHTKLVAFVKNKF